MWLYVPLKKLSFESLIEILIVNKKVFKFLTIVPAIVRIKKRVMGRKEKENMAAFVQFIWMRQHVYNMEFREVIYVAVKFLLDKWESNLRMTKNIF